MLNWLKWIPMMACCWFPCLQLQCSSHGWWGVCWHLAVGVKHWRVRCWHLVTHGSPSWRCIVCSSCWLGWSGLQWKPTIDSYVYASYHRWWGWHLVVRFKHQRMRRWHLGTHGRSPRWSYVILWSWMCCSFVVCWIYLNASYPVLHVWQFHFNVLQSRVCVNNRQVNWQWIIIVHQCLCVHACVVLACTCDMSSATLRRTIILMLYEYVNVFWSNANATILAILTVPFSSCIKQLYT